MPELKSLRPPGRIEVAGKGLSASCQMATTLKFPSTRAKWGMQIAEGIAFIHSGNIVWRDCIPSNILLGADLDVMLCDSCSISAAGLDNDFRDSDPISADKSPSSEDLSATYVLLLLCMHFSKTYAQLLAELPPELSENAVQYRQLKKLINQVVSELALLGLGPTVLHDLLQTGVDASAKGTGKGAPARVMYEFKSDSGNIEPRLRLWVDPPQAPPPPDRVEEVEEAETENAPQVALLWALQRHVPSLDTASQTVDSENKVEIVIPLASDSAFFQLLATTLHSLSDHLLEMQAQFVKTLQQLTITVSNSARPVSSTSSSFRAHSAFKSDAGGVRVVASSKSDLYAWREIFQLYVEAEIFESVGERKRGDHSVEESEKRLKQFAERVTDRGLGGGRKLKLAQSRKALESFLQLNLFILNVKKFELANAEATRKILKKHAKRTALPATDSSNTTSLALLPASDTSLPRILVQELGTTLLPIIPSLDDYACLICTSIAFKPIRLSCGHLFCVRCLVKMQKRGNAHCPMCRAPCVLLADRSNVDWALLNFMRDWFPEESTLKLKQNEREATNEQLEEMGIDPNERCIVM